MSLKVEIRDRDSSTKQVTLEGKLAGSEDVSVEGTLEGLLDGAPEGSVEGKLEGLPPPSLPRRRPFAWFGCLLHSETAMGIAKTAKIARSFFIVDK